MNLQPHLSMTLPIWHAALVLGPTLATATAALFAGPGANTATAWRGARWAVGSAMGFAALSLATATVGGEASGHGVRADAVGGVVMLLVAFVGWVIVRYSQPYLNGERGERHYVRWLMATLASVTAVIATNNVLVLALAWSTTSLALHRLLTFYGERPPAVVAAHKKFIVARLADACMLVAAGLLFHAFGTLQVDEIVAQAAATPQLPWVAQAAMLSIVGAAILKCAQLPFHGWLIQVMESPTPVSALLHAGVINLGGFVLMRFAPLMAEVPAAQAVLVVAGTTTAVLAALVMTTRISVKVMLAWSTCAQMGFMLMQCGLGAWQMAFLHLVAHSLYKAHAFLGAGGAVRSAMVAQLAPRALAPGPLALVSGVLVGMAMTLSAEAIVGWVAPGHAASPAIRVLAGILALALVPLVHAQSLRLGGWWLPALGFGAFGVTLTYFALHAVLAASILPNAAAPAAALWIGVALAFGTLFLIQSILTVAPRGNLARRLYPWCFGGLYLDEKFNRLAFALWRPPEPAKVATPLPVGDATTAIDDPIITAGARA